MKQKKIFLMCLRSDFKEEVFLIHFYDINVGKGGSIGKPLS
jgi:hypothetical protein